jgi:diguanylate cyclase (GGDEF)-like protein/putative nucleotidyltransferase with HDIG domain
MAFLFVLFSLTELSAAGTLLIGSLAITISSPFQAERRNRLLLTASDLLSFGAGTLAAFGAYQELASAVPTLEVPILYLAASAACFLGTAIPAFLIISFGVPPSERASAGPALAAMLPSYLLAGVVTGLFAASRPLMGWQTLALYLPLALLLWYLYRISMARLERYRARRAEVEGLHLRTIETLALAIGARDAEMSRHLERVQVYAVEMGKVMGLSHPEIEGLKAAALLHDIGKLAVPEHIISKPGRLTSEEFERMKVHPTVGAEILARAQFPYPVAPIVRHHHERWDGTGYPDGLKGDAIPLGARILTVVDCLDALASDRQYRRALPIDEAVAQVAAGAGKQFDPKIIARLKANYRTWEVLVERRRRVSASEVSKPEEANRPGAFHEVVRTIKSASVEVSNLFDLTQELGNSLNLADTFATLSSGLRRLLPYSGMAVYLSRRGKLNARHIHGGFAATPDMLELSIGEGVSGLVAETGTPAVNADPMRETSDPLLSIYFRPFRSALSVAIPGPDSIVGVLTLYHTELEFFTSDHLRIIQALMPKISLAISNGMRFQMAEDRAGTDHLTGLPNAHTLYLHLEHEIGLSRCMSTPLAVAVCDLNGFKAINDTLGHLVGNQLLQAVGKALRESCRDYDFVARMGGDEFVIILSGVHEKEAATKIQQLREAIRGTSAEVCKGATMYGSFGLAMYPADALTADELLAVADRNMYRDKETQHLLRAKAANSIKTWAASRNRSHTTSGAMPVRVPPPPAKPGAVAPLTATSFQTPYASPSSSSTRTPGKGS